MTKQKFHTKPDLIAILDPSSEGNWHGCIAFDSFSQKIVWAKSPDLSLNERPTIGAEIIHTDIERICLTIYDQTGLLARSPEVQSIIRLVAERNTINPLQQSLKKTTWDGKERLSAWLSTYLGAEDTELNRAIGRAWLTSAIARAFNPGCQVDCGLILEGGQGTRKSTALSVICGAEYFTDQVPDITSKDCCMQLQGMWIIEFGELDSINKSEITAVKAFISRRVDRYRPPYMPNVINVPRSCVFAGSTNETDYLADQTGNRRFYCVETGYIAIEALRADRDQLIAEAVAAFEMGEQYWLSKEMSDRLTESNQDRTKSLPWEGLIGTFLYNERDSDIALTNERLYEELKIEPKDQLQAKHNQLHAVMKKLGYKKAQRRKDGKKQWVWIPKEHSTTDPIDSKLDALLGLGSTALDRSDKAAE